MSIFDKIIGKLSFIWKGNKKKVSKQKDARMQVQQEKGVVNVFNIENISVAQIKQLSQADETQDVQTLIQGAGQRFLAEETAKQNNLGNTVKKASLDKIENPNKLEQDWFLKWMGAAKEVSRKEIQNILAQILSGEVQIPNSYSLRTLEVVKSLSREELIAFQQFVAVSSPDGFFHLGRTSKADVLRKYNLDFGNYVHLADIGLFNSSSSLNIIFDIKASIPHVIYINNIKIIISSEQDKKLQLQILKFTDVGREVFSLLLNNSINPKFQEYLGDLVKHIEGKGFKVEKHEIKGSGNLPVPSAS